MNRRQVIEDAIRHVETMTALAIGKDEHDETACLYESPTGPCLIGAMLPAELRRLADGIRGTASAVCGFSVFAVDVSADHLRIRAALGVETEIEAKFLNDVQRVHDRWANRIPTLAWADIKEAMVRDLRIMLKAVPA